MPSMDRRSLIMGVLGIGVAAATLGSATTSALALPRAQSSRSEPELDAADASPGAANGEPKLHNAQYIVIRRRPRRRWIVRRPIRRRRRVYFY